jgi:cation:H+ antiporter
MTIALGYLISLVVIVVAAELFTNAVEWAGFRMHLAQGATGSLIAAIGTALPEAVVPVVALLNGGPTADSVAMGAVLGAPFLLLTLGVAITGVAVILRRERRQLVVDRGQARRDLGVFVAAFSVVAIATVLPLAARIPLGIGLLAGYGGYVLATLRGGAPSEQMPEPLHLVRWGSRPQPQTVFVVLQLVLATALLIAGSTLFVHSLDETSRSLSINPLIIAVIAVPLATELPETLNSVLWIRSRDDGLAFGNVAGSATFQACILGFIGLTFTSWRPGTSGLATAGVTLATGAFLLVMLRNGTCHGRWLLVAGLPWAGLVAAQLLL